MALVLGANLVRIEWQADAYHAKMYGKMWLNGARAAKEMGYSTRTPTVYYPTLEGLDDAPPDVRAQIEAALQEA